MKYFFYFLIPLLFFSSCSETVEKFDERYHKKILRKGFISKEIELNDHQVFFYDNQLVERPTLIFIHGFGADGKITWKNQLEALHPDYRIIIPDILWFGKSNSSHEPSLLAQIDAIASLIELLDPENVHVIGISYGGFITLGLAHLHPELAQSITIVNSPGALMKDEDITAFNERVGVDDIKNAFIPKNEEELKRLIDFSFYKKPFFPRRLLPQILATYFSQHPKEQGLLIDELDQHREKLAGKVKPPVQIIWGEHDNVFPLYLGRALQDELGAELTVIKDAGHAVNGEKVKDFNQAIKSWIDGFQEKHP